MPAIRVQRYHSPVGDLLLGAYNDKLCLCDWDLPGRGERTQRRLSRRLQADYEAGTSSIVKAAARQLDAYFAGGRKELSVPLLPVGTPFQQRVWLAVQAVPYGHTITYKQLALRLGCPEAVRAVAASVGANALSLFLPCHRITGSGGALVGYAGGVEAKRRLLRLEQGVASAER
ncbi:MAG: methylated-DNA--[protein]-cysteine S-methyltransferase [Prevotellaceae bacterium]|nr:methylated-DNA--[protein]-cysteine S-methyltransferase [Prevotellaceae bacterium]